MNNLNIVYIGGISFPWGLASTKRRRYMIDFLNSHGVFSHVLVTRYKKRDVFNNPMSGTYGLCDFYDLSDYINNKKIFSYYQEGKKKLKEWYNNNKRNILIFPTQLLPEELYFYYFAKKIGYSIYFDQVETTNKYIYRDERSIRKRLYHGLGDIIRNFTMKNCDGSFVITEALRQQTKKEFPFIPLCYLPNSTHILQSRKKIKLNDPIQILYSGTFAEKDGIKYLLKAVSQLLDEGFECKLILTGKGLPRDMMVLENYKDYKNIEYRGLVSDEELIQLELESDILTMTRTNSTFSNFGFPFKLSEYLSTGNIVLATNVSDVSKFLTDKVNAFLVEPENSNAIANAIKFIYQNPDVAIKIGHEGLNIAKTKFSVDRVGKIFTNFLKEESQK